jgi:osmotically-inducible protein OsmY
MRNALTVAVFSACLGWASCAGSLRTPPQTDDAGITSLASRRLADDLRLCRYQFTVIVSGRAARLEGRVSSNADKHRAVELTREAGATRVEDLLVVDPAAGEGARC